MGGMGISSHPPSHSDIPYIARPMVVGAKFRGHPTTVLTHIFL